MCIGRIIQGVGGASAEMAIICMICVYFTAGAKVGLALGCLTTASQIGSVLTGLNPIIVAKCDNIEMLFWIGVIWIASSLAYIFTQGVDFREYEVRREGRRSKSKSARTIFRRFRREVAKFSILFWLLCLFIFLSKLATSPLRVISRSFFETNLNHFGGNSEVLDFFTTVMDWPGVVLAIVVGALVDKFKNRSFLLFFSAVLQSISLGILAFVRVPSVLIPFLVCTGISKITHIQCIFPATVIWGVNIHFLLLLVSGCYN
eukprot:TRINITY_DN2958_c0_g1_i4.p1 TRINITY_DN2958_c0_g1~~TRINITY_DN2958_c0_g1_i4.p1  ORF type:complete len:260 (+),score=25.62 TRINITY_DN2958_c0_g1_i4:99-878(+)